MLGILRQTFLGSIVVFLTVHSVLREFDCLDDFGERDPNDAFLGIEFEPLSLVVVRNDRRSRIQPALGDLA